MRISELFKRACGTVPSRAAIISHHGGTWSYSYLESIVDKVATSLRQAGIRAGDVVGISIPRANNLFIASKLAIWSCDACVAVLTGLPKGRLKVVNELCGPKYVIEASSLVAELDVFTVKQQHDYSFAINALYLGFTSGSSGTPKAVVVSEDSALNVFKEMSEIVPTEWSTWLAVSPDSFDISYVELIYPLIMGMTCIVYLSEKQHLHEVIKQHKPDVLQATPATWELLLASGWTSQQYPHIRLVGGERFPPKLAQDLYPNSTVLYNLYGPTEATIWCSHHKISERDLKAMTEIPLGVPFAGNEFFIEESELCVTGVNVAVGYLNVVDGERSINKFNGSYATGDIVAVGEDGSVRFLHRKDHQTKVRGNRIDLKEIENHALQIRPISSAVAVVQGSGSQAILSLFYTTTQNSTETDASVQSRLQEHFKQHLPTYMRPTFVEKLNQIPLTSSNKVDVKMLPNALSIYEQPVRGTGGPLTFDTLTDIITSLVKPLLEWEEGSTEDFHTSELHPQIGSIGIVVLANRISQQLTPLVDNFDQKWHPTEDGVPVILNCATVITLIHKLSEIVGIKPPVSLPSSSNKPKQKRAHIKSKGTSLPELISLSKEGKLDEVARVLKENENNEKFDVDMKDRFGSTALHYAAGAGHLKVCELLVACGSNDKLADKKSGRTALHWAARSGQLEICKWLVSEKSHSTELRAKDDTTPLQLAAWGGHVPTCEWFMSLGSDINFINKWGCTAVHFSALSGALPTVQWLYGIGLDLTFCNYQGHNSLHKAAYGGHKELCEWLLDGPPQMDISVRDVRGQSVDMLAAKAGYDELAEWLRGRMGSQ
eukprot:TRINITY_DN16517_c0_g1_i1.p1 TRINITY_DN16517_c0_g1~~TRINITY_DN16517_c0_g1_i1.p1  ORF type:complete len:828 (+),score=112.49 TRINITY_DN16517_c0_g1_i1:61-2544(+)